MKHYLFCFLFTAVMAFSFSSCNDSDTEVTIGEEKKVDSQLISNLKDFNNSLVYQNFDTRGKWWRKFWTVCGADAVGAFLGFKAGAELCATMPAGAINPGITATILGVFAVGNSALYSIGASRNYSGGGDCSLVLLDYNTGNIEVHSGYTRAYDDKTNINYIDIVLASSQDVDVQFVNEQTEEKVLLSENILSQTNLDEKAKELGRRHNVILSLMEGKATMAKKAESSTETDFLKEILKSDIFLHEVEKVNDMDFTKPLRYDSSIPEIVLTMYNEAFEGYVTCEEDAIYLINYYIEEVNKSDELTQDEKNSVAAGLATSLYSFSYWNEEQ